MNRTKTGIPGLDEKIEGGFPEGRTVLVTGATGTGKTILSLQFVYEGAKKYKEPGIYVTLDERAELVRKDVERFGWNLKQLEEQNLFEIIDASVARIGMPSQEQFSMPAAGFDLDKLLLEILRSVKRIKAKRVVIDSIPALGLNLESENEIRKSILKITFLLSKLGVTSIVTSEIPEGSNVFSKYGVEEYVVDGVIVLHYLSIGSKANRTIHIRKMRATKHSESLHPIKVSEKGLKLSD